MTKHTTSEEGGSIAPQKAFTLALHLIVTSAPREVAWLVV